MKKAIAGSLSMLFVLTGCQQTPPLSPSTATERAAYSEWICDGEPVLAQFYGARVVISDRTSSSWLDRGTQVGKVFRADAHEFRFEGDSATWQRQGETFHCTKRELPASWQRAEETAEDQLRFMAVSSNPEWVFRLDGTEIIMQLPQRNETQRLQAGAGDYYLDMWTYNIQTQQDRMRVQIIDGLCRNLNDNMPYPSSIQINWNDQVFQGCGRWLVKGDHRP
ncbi:hypothetical protein ACR0ST_11535 [Aliidiomarina sp. Khilg15.8]